VALRPVYFDPNPDMKQRSRLNPVRHLVVKTGREAVVLHGPRV